MVLKLNIIFRVNLEQIKVVQPRIIYPKSIQRTKIICIYAVILGCTAVFAIWFCLYYAAFFTRASRNLHEKMFNRLIRATMNFFSTNSVGKILNRFAKDLSLVDEHIPIVLLEVVLVSIKCFFNYHELSKTQFNVNFLKIGFLGIILRTQKINIVFTFHCDIKGQVFWQMFPHQ